jgi:hypothetical protein
MVDSNNPEVIGTLRREFRKDNQYSAQGIKDIIVNCRKYNTPIETRLFVVPKNFAIEGKQMLQHAVMLMDDPDGLVAIPEKHKELLLALRSRRLLNGNWIRLQVNLCIQISQTVS